MARKIARYGYRPDFGDHRDFKYADSAPAGLTIQAEVDLRSKMPEVWDQGDLGACTAFALNACVSFLHPGFVGSKLWLYYKERAIEHSIRQDSGAQLRDGISVLVDHGIPAEDLWPYIIADFKKAPSKAVNLAASKDLIKSYHRLNGAADYKACLSEGFPFAVGITVFESFEDNAAIATGMIRMPTNNEQCLGGHAVCVVGYRSDGMYIVRNSWGPGVMDHGYFYLPAEYLENPNLATDAWMIRKEF
jgi:C1A family cysteine protease